MVHLKSYLQSTYNSTDFDKKFAAIISNLPLATGIEISHILSGRLGDIGKETANALKQVAQS